MTDQFKIVLLREKQEQANMSERLIDHIIDNIDLMIEENRELVKDEYSQSTELEKIKEKLLAYKTFFDSAKKEAKYEEEKINGQD